MTLCDVCRAKSSRDALTEVALCEMNPHGQAVAAIEASPSVELCAKCLEQLCDVILRFIDPDDEN
jgi:hypothetical protein